ncbi:MAG: GspH/FimT family pseudopilin [Desulfobacteraceae bacterium]
MARAANGFSLLELMVVLALMVLIMGLVLPGLRRSWEKEKTRGSLRELAATLRAARSTAATERQRIRVFFDLQAGRYWVENIPRQGSWPPRLQVGDAHLVWQNPEARQGYIAFYGDGSSSGGRLELFDPDGQHYRLDVKVITGRVRFDS